MVGAPEHAWWNDAWGCATLLATVPIHLATEPDWELRVAKVEDRATGWVRFAGDWPAAASA